MTTPLPPIRVSASAVRDYRACPYRFVRNYLAPLEAHERRVVRVLGIGEVIHRVIADFFRHGGWNAVALDDLEVLLQVHWRAELFADADLSEANYQRTYELLVRFFEVRYPRHVARELGVERRHSWRRYRRGMLAVGRIDYACLLENGVVELLDWKTGRRRGGVDDFETDEQVLFYRSLGAEAYAHLAPRSIRVTLFFLTSATPLTVDLEREDFEAGWARIEAIATAIRQGIAAVSAGMPLLEAFPPRRGVHCSLCPIGAHCDALAAAGKLIAPPEGGAA